MKRKQQDPTVHPHTGILGATRGRYAHGSVSDADGRPPRVNRRFWFVFTSWDLDLPHQTHPQNPIHTSLTQFVTV